jgi:peptidoglycan/LPS O-acetylase OafA/YrhL
LWTQRALRPEDGRFIGYYLAAVALFAISWRLRNRAGGSRLVTLLSLLTYATYLFHAFLIRALERGIDWLLPRGSGFLLGTISPNKLGAIALFFVAMAGLVALLEQPIVRWSKRLA